MGRDSFVAITTQTFTTVLLSAFADSYQVPASVFVRGFEYTELTSAIGTPDFEVNLVMTAEGLQLEVVNTASNERIVTR